MHNPAPRILRKLLRVSKRLGVDAVLAWNEMALQDMPDPVTGRSSSQRQPRSLTIKVLKHDVAPAKTGYRVFSEIAIGDCIIDFVTPLVRVTDAGDTTLAVGETTDQFRLNAANRATTGLKALAVEVDINTLLNLTITVDGVRWVQKEVGGELAKSWDATLGGKRISQSLLFRRAT